MSLFVDVILPLPLSNRYTYILPDDLAEQVKMGIRVIVPFGPKKYYTAIVTEVHERAPEGYKLKSVVEILDRAPIIFPGQLRFWEWIASYYLCTIGDVYKAALPSGLKLESETLVICNPDFDASVSLNAGEQTILESLANGKERNLATLQKECHVKNILPYIKTLLEKEAIFIKEEVRRSYKPKMETRVRLCDPNVECIQTLLESLKRAPKQQAVLRTYIELACLESGEELEEVCRKDLLEKSGASSSILNELIEKGIFELYQFEIGHLKEENQRTDFQLVHPLNDYQQKAFAEINHLFSEKNICLLHGVTASGKTEIYIHLIKQTLQAGRQVLYLLPEIALTTQITQRLKRVFGDQLGIYHSKFSDMERVEIWQKQLSEKEYRIILGVRSSVFLPFRNLGLVIVDEEHENTYKQQDPAPRYHARNAAIMLASMHRAKTILGTATPSIESYFNTQIGKYGLVSLSQRHHAVELPQIMVVDIAELIHKRRMKGAFSPLLLEKMRQALEQKEQVILFQNRRGFAPMIECHTCGWVPKCKNCDVSLTYHKGLKQLTCHYCGYTYSVPQVCPACNGNDLRNRGFGTERIEDEIREIFPEARIARMDLDTTRTRSAHEQIIADFQQKRTDILIGTQMVSKGLDFEHVSVVGILNADSMMNFPDFRSHERAFQLMVQVSGRAGRKKKQGTVVLQTKSKDSPLIEQIVKADYPTLYENQMAERLLFKYPPFHRLVYIYLKHKHAELVDAASREMAIHLRRIFGSRILGPDAPPIARIQTLYIRKIILKIETSVSLSKVYEQLQYIHRLMQEDERFRYVTIYFDVDPY